MLIFEPVEPPPGDHATVHSMNVNNRKTCKSELKHEENKSKIVRSSSRNTKFCR